MTVISARNEEALISNTIRALNAQTVKTKIIVVDDGSTDRTATLAKAMKCDVIYCVPHLESYIGRPELAKVWNRGFDSAKRYAPKYVMALGADHTLPSTYIEDILFVMDEDVDVVVASGRIAGESYSKTSPRGSGRVIRCSFWDYSYPESWGWETWILYKALVEGKKCVCYHNIVSKTRRPTSMTSDKAFCLGKSMKALGYYWIYALGRCAKFFSKNPKLGIKMFNGWRSDDVEKLDVADFVKATQRADLFSSIRRTFRSERE